VEAKVMNKEILVLGIALLLVCVGLSGCSDTYQHPNGLLYVGYGSDVDFQSIQDAIGAAENGGTIIIKNGTYDEVIVINKTITLIGEDKNTTIINFNPEYDISSSVSIITINADNCCIENLQLTFSNKSVIVQGISIDSNNNTIKNNIITNFTNGLALLANSESNEITYNEIKNNQIGIVTSNSDTNVISYNIISNSQIENIYLSTDSNTNKVFFNILKNSEYGIRIKGSQENTVYKNCITNNRIGVFFCCGAISNFFYNNTLFNNSEMNALEGAGPNVWYHYPNGPGNYWDDYNGSDENHDGIGDTPYEDPDAENPDMYPLMIPPLDVPCNQ
jgi:parallel beta-helix repeat protein